MLDDTAIRPTWVEVDLAALRDNARAISRAVDAPMYAVIKADAYGHGALPVARALSEEPCVHGFAVSLVEEGVALRDGGIDATILVMGAALTGAHDDLVQHHLTPILATEHDAVALERAAARRDVRVGVHLMLDTGMGRIGFAPRHFNAALQHLRELPHIAVTGLATHFACADTDDPNDPASMTRAQVTTFDHTCDEARALGLLPKRDDPERPVEHMANSAAALWFPGLARDLVRVGLALYGNVPDDRVRQVMRLCSRVAQIRVVDTGQSVSYGALWRASRPTDVAVLPVGYADGVPRRMTGRAEVLVHGERAPVIGAVTMDTILVDITDLRDRVVVGDPVVILGAQGEQQISAREFAERAGCIEYEVTCGMSKRVPRVYRTGSPSDGSP